MTKLLWEHLRRLLPIATVIALLGASAARAQTVVAPAGTGTQADPYRITELGNLVWMSANVAVEGTAGKYYIVINDIDASDSAHWNGGFTPIGTWNALFEGSFDGQGHSIGGLVVNRPTATSTVGLFGSTGFCGSVTNLTLAGGSVTGSAYVGGLVGTNAGTITNCAATCSVTATSNILGGLVGGNGGAIVHSYATGAVTLLNPDIAYIDGCVGGLVGMNAQPVTNCFATGAVSGGSIGPTAGLVGSNAGLLTDCYATGAVTGTGTLGGLVGDTDSTSQCLNCYWDTDASGLSVSAGGAGKSTTQMHEQATFVGWDFANVWRIVEGRTYPFFPGPDMPLMPTAVAATKGAFSDRVRVTWTGSPGASDFEVWRSTHPTTATATALTTWAPETTYDDMTAELGVIYYYWVVAAADATGTNRTAFSACDRGWAGTPAFPSNYRGALWLVH